MKHLGRVLLYVLLICLALSLCACGNDHSELSVSSSMGDWSVETSASGLEYLYCESTGEKIIQVFCYDEDGRLIELPLKDCAEIKNQTPVISGSFVCNKDALKSRTPKTSRSGYSFEPSDVFTALGTGEKLTADVKGTASITIGSNLVENLSVVSATSTGSAAVNGAIASGAGFAWNSSLPVSLEEGFSVQIPEGEICYVQFEPYLNVAQGSVFKSASDKDGGAAWGVSPAETASGCADGLIEIVVR